MGFGQSTDLYLQRNKFVWTMMRLFNTILFSIFFFIFWIFFVSIELRYWLVISKILQFLQCGYRQTDRWTNRQTNGWMDQWMEQWIYVSYVYKCDRRILKCWFSNRFCHFYKSVTDRLTDRSTDRQTDRWTDGQTLL